MRLFILEKIRIVEKIHDKKKEVTQNYVAREMLTKLFRVFSN